MGILLAWCATLSFLSSCTRPAVADGRAILKKRLGLVLPADTHIVGAYEEELMTLNVWAVLDVPADQVPPLLASCNRLPNDTDLRVDAPLLDEMAKPVAAATAGWWHLPAGSAARVAARAGKVGKSAWTFCSRVCVAAPNHGLCRVFITYNEDS